MITYHFTPEDQRLIDHLAHLRNDRKEAIGVTSKKFDPSKSEWEAHYQGILGEVGAARALGLEVDTEEILSGDSGVDLKLGGLSIEVRYRTKRGWDFALNGPDISFLKSDIGILVWPGEPADSVELVGWTTRVHLASHGQINNFGYGDRLVLDAHHMLHMDQLTALVDRIRTR